MKENADKTRALDTTEINKQLKDQSEQMFRLRFQMSMGQAEGLKKLRSLRRERARMLTVLRERELHPESAAPKPVAKPAKSKAAAKPKAAAKAPAKKATKPKATSKG
jgi:large subunit ribosomal protein L29